MARPGPGWRCARIRRPNSPSIIAGDPGWDQSLLASAERVHRGGKSKHASPAGPPTTAGAARKLRGIQHRERKSSRPFKPLPSRDIRAGLLFQSPSLYLPTCLRLNKCQMERTYASIRRTCFFFVCPRLWSCECRLLSVVLAELTTTGLATIVEHHLTYSHCLVALK